MRGQPLYEADVEGGRRWGLRAAAVITLAVAFAQPWRPARVLVVASDERQRLGADPDPIATPASTTDAGPSGGDGSGTRDADVHTGASQIQGDWHKYPVPQWCVYRMTRCTTPKGELGVRCANDPVCFNPCPPGRAPNEAGVVCERTCRSDKDCNGGTCTREGLCEAERPCEVYGDACVLPNNVTGHMCEGKCVNPCGRGKVLVGGTHCAKQCWADADCPGFGCWKGGGLPYVCNAPLCPSNGCPYPWD